MLEGANCGSEGADVMWPNRVFWPALLAAVGLSEPALAQHHPHHPVQPIGHHPVSPVPIVHAPHGGGGAVGGGGGFGGGGGGFGGGSSANYFNYNTSYYNNSSYWGGLGYSPVGFFGYRPYGYYGFYGGFGPYVLPPLVLPAQTLFGPQPIQQMMGLGFNPGVAGGANVGGGQANAANDPLPAARPRKPRVSNAEAKARAGKFIDFGDALFAKQQFRQALERYKLAAQQAPDMAEIYLREGIAMVAIGQYESAGKAFRRGLKLPDWNVAGVGLDQLYGADHAAKEAHLEALAMAVRAAQHDANLLFVLGMELLLSGEAERASAFFARSAQLGGNDDHLLDGFLAAPQPGAAQGPIAAPQPGPPKPVGPLPFQPAPAQPNANAGVNL